VVTLLLERSGVRPSFNISNFAKVKHPDYQYDALGRNTLIPSADAPNNNGTITLAYNTNDQVTQISQAGATTNFSHEAEGRRLTETSGTQITTRHYTDGSDNPTWSTQAATTPGAAMTKTDIYTPSLGTGLNVTTTIQAGAATGSMQLHDLRGNTVTTIDLSTNTASGWCSYDEFGNPDSFNPANTANINYTTYGQAERATNTTGLILMGARVYNPETNQFTSPDPVKGGNENSYTYPNAPENFCDFLGSSSGAESDPLYELLQWLWENSGQTNIRKAKMGLVSRELAIYFAKLWIGNRPFRLLTVGVNGELTFYAPPYKGLPSRQVRFSINNGSIKMNLELGRMEAKQLKEKVYPNFHLDIDPHSPSKIKFTQGLSSQLEYIQMQMGGGLREFTY
jgi:RHS repeat-associated protein